MTTKIRHTLSILLLSLLYSIASAEMIPETPLKIASEQAINLGHSYRIGTGKTSEQIEVNVYLPDSYHKQKSTLQAFDDNVAIDRTKHYPVLYVIDGGQQQDFKQIAGLGALASINPYIFEELIVVGIATQNRLFELTSINVDKRYDRPPGYVGGAD